MPRATWILAVTACPVGGAATACHAPQRSRPALVVDPPAFAPSAASASAQSSVVVAAAPDRSRRLGVDERAQSTGYAAAGGVPAFVVSTTVTSIDIARRPGIAMATGEATATPVERAR
jgi:hypothetical protein